MGGKHKHDFSLTDDLGNTFKVYKIDKEFNQTEIRVSDHSLADSCIEQETNQLNHTGTEMSEREINSNVSYNEAENTVTVHDSMDVSCESAMPENLITLQTPSTVKPLPSGRWHNADQIFNLIARNETVMDEVPVGNKSNCYVLVENSQNISLLSTRKNQTFMMTAAFGNSQKEIQLKPLMSKKTECCDMSNLRTIITVPKSDKKEKSFGFHSVLNQVKAVLLY